MLVISFYFIHLYLLYLQFGKHNTHFRAHSLVEFFFTFFSFSLSEKNIFVILLSSSPTFISRNTLKITCNHIKFFKRKVLYYNLNHSLEKYQEEKVNTKKRKGSIHTWKCSFSFFFSVHPRST